MEVKKGLGRIPKSLAWIDEQQKEQEKEAVEIQQDKTTQKGLQSGWTRATFIINEDLNDRMKALAYWERTTIKEVLHNALTEYLQSKEEYPLPKKK